ncbi:MAG: dienelactone hydrolase family protein [Planctomycetota bacterium]
MKIATLALLAAFSAGALAQTPPPTPRPDARPGKTPEQEVKKGAPEKKGGDTGLTGVLDEESFARLHELTGAKAPPARGTMITLPSSKAYLSLPEKARAPLPAVIVIHEWWGLNEHIKHWTDRLAADGYAALAVDLYGGEVATTREEAMKLMSAADDDAAKKVLAEAFAFLAKDERIKAKRRAVIGWCFGGGHSLRTALAEPELDAAVIYYGRLQTDPEVLKSIKAEVLGVFGNQDRGIPPATVDEFEKGLKAAGVKHEILRYDANHAFANPSSGRYDAKSAGAAWKKVRAFLAKRLRPEAKGAEHAPAGEKKGRPSENEGDGKGDKKDAPKASSEGGRED